MTDVLKLASLTASNFDVVNLAPIVTGVSPTNGPSGSVRTINGQNFSGAAGQLSAFFGTNAATAVNVLSDTQISVTVPGGNGTVDMKVRSGIMETDLISSSPSANVNAPIFGYGVSALTLTDKFLYLPPTPTFQRVLKLGGNLIANGTNNNGPGGTYHVLTATNLQLPLADWTVWTNGNFDNSGKFAFTNAIATTNQQLFYLLQVP